MSACCPPYDPCPKHVGETVKFSLDDFAAIMRRARKPIVLQPKQRSKHTRKRNFRRKKR